MEKFWNWFIKNNHKYLFINQIEDLNKKEILLDEFADELHKYCNNLFFQIGGFPQAQQELIITAEGDLDYFDKVEELIDGAPQVAGWKFIKFKPGLEEIDHFISEYAGIILNTRDIFFECYTIAESEDLGIKIFIKDYNSISHIPTLHNQVCNIVETIIGERAFAMDIKYFDIEPLENASDLDQELDNIFNLSNVLNSHFNK